MTLEAMTLGAGNEHAAVTYSTLGTAKLNGIDPEAYLRDTLARIATPSIGPTK